MRGMRGRGLPITLELSVFKLWSTRIVLNKLLVYFPFCIIFVNLEVEVIAILFFFFSNEHLESIVEILLCRFYYGDRGSQQLEKR